MNSHCVIPLNKTISEYLAEIGETPQHSSEFIEINKGGMVIIGDMDNDDYSVFWKCMRIYEALGINYFAEYVYLRQSYYGNFSHGIEHWFNDNSFMGMRPDVATFKKFVDKLRFFEIKYYHGISLHEFEKAYQKADILYYVASENEKQCYREKGEKTIQEKIENYFNYERFSGSCFNDFCNSLIEELKKSISINDALLLARTAPAGTYIVILKNNNGICHINKTKQPLSYIEKYQKKYDANFACFKIIDKDYIDDLVVHMRILYDIEIEKIHPTNLNRKYATVKQAVYAYSRSGSFTSKQIMSAIEKHSLRTVPINHGQMLIDKIALGKALYHKNK